MAEEEGMTLTWENEDTRAVTCPVVLSTSILALVTTNRWCVKTGRPFLITRMRTTSRRQMA